MVKVFVVKQIRKYETGETKYVEIECTSLDLAARIREPYMVTKPKKGSPYAVISKSAVSIRNVEEIKHPIDDIP